MSWTCRLDWLVVAAALNLDEMVGMDWLFCCSKWSGFRMHEESIALKHGLRMLDTALVFLPKVLVVSLVIQCVGCASSQVVV